MGRILFFTLTSYCVSQQIDTVNYSYILDKNSKIDNKRSLGCIILCLDTYTFHYVCF